MAVTEEAASSIELEAVGRAASADEAPSFPPPRVSSITGGKPAGVRFKAPFLGVGILALRSLGTASCALSVGFEVSKVGAGRVGSGEDVP